MAGEGDITRLLNEAAQGDRDAGRAVFPLIYDELRKLASSRRSRLPSGETLQTTALVHEAYLKVVDRNPEGWAGVRHFYFTAARAMRDILVEDARRKSSRKRGGNLDRLDLGENTPWTYDISPDEVLSLESALQKLEQDDPDGHMLVLLRFYAGLTNQEIADVLGASSRTVERKWRFLRVWLAKEIGEAP